MTFELEHTVLARACKGLRALSIPTEKKRQKSENARWGRFKFLDGNYIAMHVVGTVPIGLMLPENMLCIPNPCSRSHKNRHHKAVGGCWGQKRKLDLWTILITERSTSAQSSHHAQGYIHSIICHNVFLQDCTSSSCPDRWSRYCGARTGSRIEEARHQLLCLRARRFGRLSTPGL